MGVKKNFGPYTSKNLSAYKLGATPSLSQIFNISSITHSDGRLVTQSSRGDQRA